MYNFASCSADKWKSDNTSKLHGLTGIPIHNDSEVDVYFSRIFLWMFSMIDSIESLGGIWENTYNKISFKATIRILTLPLFDLIYLYSEITESDTQIGYSIFDESSFQVMISLQNGHPQSFWETPFICEHLLNVQPIVSTQHHIRSEWIPAIRGFAFYSRPTLLSDSGAGSLHSIKQTLWPLTFIWHFIWLWQTSSSWIIT